MDSAMLTVPKEPPVIANLNTYYVDLGKLIEHYQGEIGAGSVFFRSPSAEGVLFFDQDEILSGYFSDRETTLSGSDALQRLLGDDHLQNFTIDIYRIPQSEVYFWSSLPASEKIYKDLSTEFSDLEGLVKKMAAEKLTGYIDVSIGDKGEGGIIFFSNGEIVGGSFSWATAGNSQNKINIATLIEKTKTHGGTFQVCRMPMAGDRRPPAGGPAVRSDSAQVIQILEEFLNVFETCCTSRKARTEDLNSLIRKKFVSVADTYTFLDPFAAEFEYTDRRITFTGAASDAELANGVVRSISELAAEIGISEELRTYLGSWSRKYEKELASLGVQL
jgi:hypothetical protein